MFFILTGRGVWIYCVTWKPLLAQTGVLPSAWFRRLNHIVSVVQIQYDTRKIKNTPQGYVFYFNWLRSVDLLRHLETFAGANRRTAVRLVSAVEPHCFCGSNPMRHT